MLRTLPPYLHIVKIENFTRDLVLFLNNEATTINHLWGGGGGVVHLAPQVTEGQPLTASCMSRQILGAYIHGHSLS